jgi:hypothetical protein
MLGESEIGKNICRPRQARGFTLDQPARQYEFANNYLSKVEYNEVRSSRCEDALIDRLIQPYSDFETNSQAYRLRLSGRRTNA